MNKIKSIFKVLTFINIEIIGMSIFMIFSIFFGIYYTNNTIDYIEYTNSKIKSNSEINIHLSNNTNQFNLIDHLIIKKSLDGENITRNIEEYVSYRDSFLLNEKELLRFDSLLDKKTQISDKIFKLKYQIVCLEKRNFEEIDSTLISKKDVYKSQYSDKYLKQTIDNFEYKISDEIKDLLSSYNMSTYRVNHLLNFKSEYVSSNSIRTQDLLIKNLKNRFIYYILVMSATLLFFILICYLLYKDIRAKSKVENRNRYFISQLLNRK